MKKTIFFSLVIFLSSCTLGMPAIPSQDNTSISSAISINSGEIVDTDNFVASHTWVEIQTPDSLLHSSQLDQRSPCPNLQTGFKNLDRAMLNVLYEHADFSIFEALCDSEAEKNFITTLKHSPGSIYSIIYYDKKNNTIKPLPIFGSAGNQLNKTITSSTYEIYVVGLSEKSIPEKVILDILHIDRAGGIEKVGEIEPSSVDSKLVLYPDGIAYFSKIPWELRLFNFINKADQLIAKDIVQFVSVYSDGKSKVFNEGWNLFYYGYPDGVGGTIEDDSKFQPSWVDVRFYTYKNGETRNTLTIKRQTKLFWWMSESTIALDSDLIKTYDMDTKNVVFFGPNRIE